MTKRLISFLLALTFIITVAPIGIFAASVDTASIAVVDASAMPGDSVEVYVIIKDNPGVTGATLTISYDDALTLTDAIAGAAFSSLAFSKPGTYASPCNFVWDAEAASDESTENGVIMKLVFEVDGAVEAYTKMNVDVSYSFGDVYNNGGDVSLDIQNGYVTAVEYVPGDVNGDDRVTTKDTQLIRQLIAGGYESAWEAAGITVNASAADVNDDGRVNSKDTQLIRQVVAGGYTDEYGVPVRLIPATPACNHSLTAFAAKDATCTEEGNIAYWYCESCNSYFSDAEGLYEISESETVTAKKNHALTHYAKKNATCTEEGNIEYWQCEECGSIFEDADAVSEIGVAETVIEAVGHTPGAQATCTEDQICTACGELIESANGHVPGLEASCTAPQRCVVCQTVLADQKPHDLFFVPETDPVDNSNPGNCAYWQCTECHKCYLDEEAENEISSADVAWQLFKITYYCNEAKWKQTQWHKVGEEVESLLEPQIEAYDFNYWKDNTGKQVSSVPAGNTDNLELYADVKACEFTIHLGGTWNYKDITYTINDRVELPTPVEDGLIFAGWRDPSGRVHEYKDAVGDTRWCVEKGTIGNIDVVAQWKDERNLIIPDKRSATERYISSGFDDGYYWFLYEMGEIRNVVLDLETDLNKTDHSGGHIAGSLSLAETIEVSETVGKSVSETVSHTVTNSTNWELMTNWEDSETSGLNLSITAGAEAGCPFAKAKFEATMGASYETTSSSGGGHSNGGSHDETDETSNTIESNFAFSKSISQSTDRTISFTHDVAPGNYYYANIGTVRVYAFVVYDPVKNTIGLETFSILEEGTSAKVLSDKKDNREYVSDELPYEIDTDFITNAIKSKFYIQYFANNGIVDENGVGESTVKSYDINMDVELSNNDFTNPGYSFIKWITADGAEYDAGETVKDLVEPGHLISMSAQWDIVSYTVSWNSEVGCNIHVARMRSDVADTGMLANGATVYYGDELAITYTLSVGYGLSACGTNTITVGEGDVGPDRIYARVYPLTYQITYHYNDGTGRTAVNNHTYDSPYDNKTYGALSRSDGYTFLGWSIYSGATVATFKPGQNVFNSLYGAGSLYAVWVKTYYTTGYYSRDHIFIDNDYEGDECITEWFSPGFNVEALLANGYTKVQVNIAVHGERNNGWAPNNEPYIDIYNANESKITTVDLDEYGSSFSIQYREFYLDLTSLVGDGRVKFRYDTKRDSWELGTTEVTMTAVK
ncbi:MAG: hypothetical protein E7619_00690 [Ruminococcaceae bacterium]|nr:hypothetical protein [Oscillospiraceae bacterium]